MDGILLWNMSEIAVKCVKGIRHGILYYRGEVYSPFRKCCPLRQPCHLLGLGFSYLWSSPSDCFFRPLHMIVTIFTFQIMLQYKLVVGGLEFTFSKNALQWIFTIKIVYIMFWDVMIWRYFTFICMDICLFR